MFPKWILFPVLLALAYLQVTLLDYFKIAGVKPDLLFMSMVICSLLLQLRWALGLSIAAGILKDIFAITPFSINTILFPLWSIVIIVLSQRITTENKFIRLGIIFIAVLFNNIVFRFLLISFGTYIPFGSFLRIMMLDCFYSVVILFLISKPLERFFERLNNAAEEDRESETEIP